jgi:hypothetical protein
MNLHEIKGAMDSNWKVMVDTPELKNKLLCIYQTSYCYNTGEVKISVRDQYGKEYDVDPGLIKIYSDSDEPNIDNNLRKEIAFLLIQNNYAIDGNFKYMVDKVVHAIGEME